MTTNEWADDFFHGLAIDFWVAVAPAPDSDLPFLENVFGAPAGQAILDVACGAGRHSIALARRGYAVTGIDLSTTCLAWSRRDPLHCHPEAAGAAVRIVMVAPI